MKELIQLCFLKKNDQRRYKYLVLERDKSYLVKKQNSDSPTKFSDTDIINMIEFLIDNIFVMFGGRVFKHTVGIPMDTNSPTCSFIRSEADFMQVLLKKKSSPYPSISRSAMQMMSFH